MVTKPAQVEFEVVGCDEPSDELLELLADMLLGLVDEQEETQ